MRLCLAVLWAAQAAAEAAAGAEQRWLLLFRERVPQAAHDWVVAAALERAAADQARRKLSAAASSRGGEWQPCALPPQGCSCAGSASLRLLPSPSEGLRSGSAAPLSAAAPTDVAVALPGNEADCCALRCTAAALRADPAVRWLGPDRVVRRPRQRAAAEGGAPRPGARRLLAGPLDVVRTLAVDEALWRRGARGQNVRVAIFDTGIAQRHRHFRKSKVRLCINYTDQRTCEDGFGHGTFVSGLVISKEDCLGMAPEAELYAFKVFTDKQVSYTSWFLDAFNHAIDQKIDVLNLSIGGPDYMDQPFVEKVWEASANGIIVVSAIGNDGPLFGTLNNPADQFDVLGVGGVTQTRRMAPFSSRGMSTWELPRGYGRMKPDVVTYGELVRSSDHRGGCKVLSGTSVASPVVTGAVTALVSLAKQRGVAHNPAAIKQVLVDSARPIGGAGIYEQGAGIVNIKGAAELLHSFRPQPSFLPRRLNLDDCPYMWPFCKKPLFYTATPLTVNITLLNPATRRATFASEPVWRTDAPEHAALLSVSTEHPAVIWPWSGWFALSILVTAAGATFSGRVEGELSVELDCEGRRHTVSLRVRAAVVPPPPRSKRVLWDMYHNLQYPPGYVPRDNLQVTSDILDWNGDHPHTNFKDTHDHLVNSGYYVDVLTSDLTSFNASLYCALLLIDTEEEFLPAEVAKLEKDVKELGLAVVVFADWYNEEIIEGARFKDDNTGEWWTPVTGGANAPALNDLLAPFGAALSNGVYHGDVHLRRGGRALRYASGSSIQRFPAGGTLYRSVHPLVDQVERLVHQRTVYRKDLPVLGLTGAGSGKLAVFGDSNCLDSAHSNLNYCFDLLSGLLQWANRRGLPLELQRAEQQTFLRGPWTGRDAHMPIRGNSRARLMEVSHVLQGGGDHFRGQAHRPIPANASAPSWAAASRSHPQPSAASAAPRPSPPRATPPRPPQPPAARAPAAAPARPEGGSRGGNLIASRVKRLGAGVDPAGHHGSPLWVHQPPGRSRRQQQQQAVPGDPHDPVVTVPPPRPGLALLRLGSVVLCALLAVACAAWRCCPRRRGGRAAARRQRAQAAARPV